MPSPGDINYRVPTTPNTGDQIATQMQEAGVPYWATSGYTQAEEDLQQMEIANGQGPAYVNITLPPGVGWQDYFNFMSNVEQFANSAGWRYAPTQQQITSMLARGMASADTSTIFRYLADLRGVAGKMPWAAAGMTHAQYDSSQAGLQDTIAEYTGDPSEYGALVSEALSKFGNSGEASNWVRTQLLTNPAYSKNSKTPWLQYGMTYQSWQDYKHQNQGLATQQYGAKGATDQQFISMYAQNAMSRSQSGGAATLAQSGSGSLVSRGAQSQVR